MTVAMAVGVAVRVIVGVAVGVVVAVSVAPVVGVVRCLTAILKRSARTKMTRVEY